MAKCFRRSRLFLVPAAAAMFVIGLNTRQDARCFAADTTNSHKIVSFYLVSKADTNIFDVPLDRFALEDKPLFTSDNMLRYDTNKHVFVLSPEALGNCQSRLGVAADRRFIVTVGKRRVYMGMFGCSLHSYMPGSIYIWWPCLDVDHELSINPVAQYTISGNWEIYDPVASRIAGDLKDNPRNDPELLAILGACNQRAAGKR